jgi:two-component system LytT family sensor kinase
MAKNAELYQLRQQLQPHFLFNSLNSINALINKNPEKAREMVLQLSEFFRGSIRKDDKKWIAITEEIAHLQLFLNIERIRFGDRLLVAFQVEEGAQQLKVPPLLIQPLLENAVKHGLNSLIGPVIVETNVKKKGNCLEITITNPYDPAGGHAPGAGFGLEAVNRRLYLLFGRRDLLVVAPSEELYTVWMKIPQVYDQDTNR